MTPRGFAPSWTASVVGVVCAVCALGLPSCGEDNPLRRVDFRVRAGGYLRDASGPPVIHSSQGWDVTLGSAQVSVGPLYFHNTAPMAGTSMAQGRVVAQVLTVFTVDVLNPVPRDIPAGGNGVTEPVLSAEVRLAEAPDGPIADAAGAGVAVAHLSGVARRGGVEIPFDGVLTLPTGNGTTPYQSLVAHTVSSIPVSFTAGEGGTVTLRVDPSHWFDFVSFDTLGPSGTTGAVVRDFASTAATAGLTPGIASSTTVFGFTWTPGP